MKTLNEVLENKDYGLYFGNRILLPFKCHVLKAIFENEIVDDFSSSLRGASYKIEDEFTEIYYHEVEFLTDVVSKYKGIKLIVVEKGKDIFDFNNHRKIKLLLDEDHKLRIEEITEDELFFE